MLAVRPIQQTYIINRTASRAETLVSHFRTKYPNLHFESIVYDATNPDSVNSTQSQVIAAVSRSHIICLMTNATSPVLLGKWVQPGTHINGVGSFK